ncbi:hypothetical protein Nmel_011788, partial [Mimus melanotis]
QAGAGHHCRRGPCTVRGPSWIPRDPLEPLEAPPQPSRPPTPENPTPLPGPELNPGGWKESGSVPSLQSSIPCSSHILLCCRPPPRCATMPVEMFQLLWFQEMHCRKDGNLHLSLSFMSFE